MITLAVATALWCAAAFCAGLTLDGRILAVTLAASRVRYATTFAEAATGTAALLAAAAATALGGTAHLALLAASYLSGAADQAAERTLPWKGLAEDG